MRIVLPCIAIVATSVLLAAQSLEVTNFRGVVSGTTHAVTGNNYPAAGTYPRTYFFAAGVLPGTRIWTVTPKLRFQGGHQGANYFTITGLTQTVHIGAAINNPTGNEYLFKQGIAPAQPSTRANKWEHAATGNDIVSFPAAALPNNPGGGIQRQTVSLTTPVAVPTTELIIYIEYKGGEYRDSTTNGQTIGCDWKGGGGESGAVYAGITEGINPRKILPFGSVTYRPQMGFAVAEPIMTATGFHANKYHTPPMTNEDYRGLAAAYSDWASNTGSFSSVFFHFSAGPTFSSGTATVLTNVGTTIFPATLATPFGGLMLNPGDPLLTAFADFGYTAQLGTQGEFDQGPMNPLFLPPLPGTVGLIFRFQGIVTDPGFNTIQLTNASGIKVLR